MWSAQVCKLAIRGDREVRVFKNPSRLRFQSILSKSSVVRGFLGSNLYIWDATLAVHADFDTHLKTTDLGMLKLVMYKDCIELSPDDPALRETSEQELQRHGSSAAIVRCYGQPMEIKMIPHANRSSHASRPR